MNERKCLKLKGKRSQKGSPQSSRSIRRLTNLFLYTEEGIFHGEVNGEVRCKGKGEFTWKTNEFCASFADADYDYEFDREMKLTYATCYNSTLTE